MTTLTPKSLAVLDTLLVKHPSDTEAISDSRPGVRDRLRQALEENPMLAAQFNEATAKGTLEKITLDAEAGTAGSYNAHQKAMRLHHEKITEAYQNTPFSETVFVKSQIADNLIFTLGHELKHAQNATIDSAGVVHAMGGAQFKQDIAAIAQSNQPGARDYTTALGNYLAIERMDEASAQIAGWNALMAIKRVDNPNITPLQLAEQLGLEVRHYGSHFFDQHTRQPVAGLTFNADGAITDNAVNREAEAKAFYDLPADQIRAGKAKTDYRNNNADAYLTQIIQVEKEFADQHPAKSYPQINMNRLGLRQADIQAQNVSLGTSRPGASAKIVDSSDPKHPKTMYFYNDNRVPDGYPATTPGLPHDVNTQGKHQTPQHQSATANAANTPGHVDHAALWKDSIAVGQQYAQTQVQTQQISSRTA
jgi:hypothetical protein